MRATKKVALFFVVGCRRFCCFVFGLYFVEIRAKISCNMFKEASFFVHKS